MDEGDWTDGFYCFLQRRRERKGVSDNTIGGWNLIGFLFCNSQNDSNKYTKNFGLLV
jgi:hypothetical protein